MDSAREKSKGDAHAHKKRKDKDEKKDPSSSEKEPDYIYSTSTSHQPDRTFFVVDLSRLKAERDTLENALVLYRPEADIKKVQYEQRCSQLVGLALCTMNFSGKYPEFVRLRGTCYAIRALGETYVMGLSSRAEEPPRCTVKLLKTLHDMFHFYYKSPDSVLRKCMEDWEIFTNTMSSIFSKLFSYLIRDQHSVPSMLSPIPYAPVNYEKIKRPNEKRNRSKLYMLASRVLKACQGHQTVLGGCILHNATILTSQFPPALTEKIAVVGGGAIPLDQYSILEDNIAPGKVWVVEVFLYDDDMDKAKSSRKNHVNIDDAYSSLHVNPNSAHHHHLPMNLNLTPPTTSKKSHGQWRNKFMSSQRSSSSSSSSDPPQPPNRSTSLRPSSANDTPPPPPTRDPPTYRPSSASSLSSSSGQPLASSTPQQHHRDSVTSEDAVQLSPGLTRVQFHQPTVKKPTLDPIVAVSRKLEKAAAVKKDDDYEDLDDWENVDPSMALPARVISKQHPTTNARGGGFPSTSNGAAPVKTTPNGDSPVVGGSLAQTPSRPSTGSMSSEGFATPPPSLPPRSHMQLPPGDESSSDHTHRDKGESLLTRHVSEMTDDEIEKLVNTPITLPQNDQPQVAMVSNARPQRIPALPSEMRSWKFKVAADPESDDDNDFVDSTELQEMLLANQLEKQTSVTTPQASEANKQALSSRSPSPPPLPPREYTLSIMRKSTSSTARDETDGGEGAAANGEIKLPVATVVGQLSKQTVVPPLHVRHVTGMGAGLLYSEHDIDGDRERGEGKDSTLKSEGQRLSASWLYSDDLDMNETVDAPGKGQSANAAENGIDSTEDDVAELYSTVQQTRLKEKSKAGHDYKTIPIPFDGQKGSPVINGNDDNTISTDQVKIQILPENTTVKAKPASPGADYDHLQEIKPLDIKNFEMTRKISSSVDRDVRTTTNGISSLSLPLTVDEQGKFQSSFMSDDVFNDSAMTPVEEPSSRDEQRLELGASEAPSLNPDDIDVSVLSGDEEEQDKQVRLDSITTEMELSSVTTVSESLMRDGTVTPVQMTLNESVANMMRYRVSPTPERASGSGTTGEEEEENELLDSAEYSSLPEEDGEIDGEGMGSKSSTRTDMTDITYEDLGRPRSKSWLTKTMELRKTTASSVKMDKKCLYIQQYMSTMVVLLADSGLHLEHKTLNQLWRSLLPQLLELDNGLKEEAPAQSAKPSSLLVTYSKLDRYCEAHPRTAAFHYRHALRRLNQEYDKDPSLLEASLFKDRYVHLLSQRVHDREVYYQPERLGGTYDSLSMSGVLASYAKEKTSLRQQPIVGPKVMLI